MPKKCTHFISGFLIPNLDRRKFGDHLKWIDRSKRIFQMDWHHKSGTNWTASEAEVFIEWDKEKGHFRPNDKEYYTQSKQRFRSLLYKLTKDQQLIPVESENKFQKVYRIGEKKKGKRRRSYELEHVESELSITDTSFEEYDDELINDAVVGDDFYNPELQCLNHSLTTLNQSAYSDHSYSKTENSQTFLNDQFEYVDFQDGFGSPTNTLNKKVLVRRNCNDEFLNISAPPPKEMPEDFMEDFAHDAENINGSRTYDKLQENVFQMFVPYSKLMPDNNVLSDIENTIPLINALME